MCISSPGQWPNGVLDPGSEGDISDLPICLCTPETQPADLPVQSLPICLCARGFSS